MDLQRQGINRDKGRKQPSPCAVAGMGSIQPFRVGRGWTVRDLRRRRLQNLPGRRILGDPKKTWDFKFPAFAPSGDRIVAQEDSGQVPHLIGITSAGERFRSFWWDIGWGAQIQPDWGPVQR